VEYQPIRSVKNDKLAQTSSDLNADKYVEFIQEAKAYVRFGEKINSISKIIIAQIPGSYLLECRYSRVSRIRTDVLGYTHRSFYRSPILGFHSTYWRKPMLSARFQSRKVMHTSLSQCVIRKKVFLDPTETILCCENTRDLRCHKFGWNSVRLQETSVVWRSEHLSRWGRMPLQYKYRIQQ